MTDRPVANMVVDIGVLHREQDSSVLRRALPKLKVGQTLEVQYRVVDEAEQVALSDIGDLCRLGFCAIEWDAAISENRSVVVLRKLAPLGSVDWLPEGFVSPQRVDLVSGHHLRPISPDDAEIDMVAIKGSRARLWSMYGRAWGWPGADMSVDEDRRDLQRHADEMGRNESFNFAVFNEAETALFGCIYVDPPERSGGAGAEISWWVVDSEVGEPLDEALSEFVPNWIASVWPLNRPRYVGIDLSWDEWLALDEI